MAYGHTAPRPRSQALCSRPTNATLQREQRDEVLRSRPGTERVRALWTSCQGHGRGRDPGDVPPQSATHPGEPGGGSPGWTRWSGGQLRGGVQRKRRRSTPGVGREERRRAQPWSGWWKGASDDPSHPQNTPKRYARLDPGAVRKTNSLVEEGSWISSGLSLGSLHSTAELHPRIQ